MATYSGDSADNTFNGTADADQANGGDGNDTLYGAAGNDQLLGEGGDDFLSGGDNDDFLSGGGGNDTLNGDDGNDEIWASVFGLTAYSINLDGGAGNDLYILTHQEFEQPLRERSEALLAAFPVEPAPQARALVARRFMTDLYARERDRRLAARKPSA